MDRSPSATPTRSDIDSPSSTRSNPSSFPGSRSRSSSFDAVPDGLQSALQRYRPNASSNENVVVIVFKRDRRQLLDHVTRRSAVSKSEKPAFRMSFEQRLIPSSFLQLNGALICHLAWETAFDVDQLGAPLFDGDAVLALVHLLFVHQAWTYFIADGDFRYIVQHQRECYGVVAMARYQQMVWLVEALQQERETL